MDTLDLIRRPIPVHKEKQAITTDIYGLYDTTFAQVTAYVLLNAASKEYAGKVAIKYPDEGAGTLKAFVHIFGQPMGAGKATGFGYDKVEAAVRAALPELGRDFEGGTWQEALLAKRNIIALEAL